MRFNRVSDTELHCKISIDEIKARGFELSDLMSKNQRAWEFFETVMEEGEDATGFENDGPMSIEGSFVGKELELVFRSIEMGSDEMAHFMEEAAKGNVKEKVRLPKYYPVISDKMAEDEAVHIEPVSVGFTSMDELMTFSRRVTTKSARVSLYTIYDMYVLVYDLDECDHNDIGQFCQLTNEYADRVLYGEKSYVYLVEHGTCITKDFIPF